MITNSDTIPRFKHKPRTHLAHVCASTRALHLMGRGKGTSFCVVQHRGGRYIPAHGSLFREGQKRDGHTPTGCDGRGTGRGGIHSRGYCRGLHGAGNVGATVRGVRLSPRGTGLQAQGTREFSQMVQGGNPSPRTHFMNGDRNPVLQKSE